jgi:F-type H+-transporting ATPase subunit epsilon
VARRTYHLSIVTPERTVYEGEVNSTTLPAVGGYVGVWANHAPMVAAVRPGLLSLHEGAREEEGPHFAVGAGFAEVSQNELVMIVDSAELEQEIDVGRAERALERAQERLRQAMHGDHDVDVSRAREAEERARARIRVAYLRGH